MFKWIKKKAEKVKKSVFKKRPNPTKAITFLEETISKLGLMK